VNRTSKMSMATRLNLAHDNSRRRQNSLASLHQVGTFHCLKRLVKDYHFSRWKYSTGSADLGCTTRISSVYCLGDTCFRSILQKRCFNSLPGSQSTPKLHRNLIKDRASFKVRPGERQTDEEGSCTQWRQAPKYQ
jgi:hypothetical protein